MLRNTSKTSLSHPRSPQSHTSNSTRTAQLERHIQYLSSTLPNSQLNLLDTTIYKAWSGSGKPENFQNHFISVLLKENTFFLCVCVCVHVDALWLDSSWHLPTLPAYCIFLLALDFLLLLVYFPCLWNRRNTLQAPGVPRPRLFLHCVTSSLVKPKLHLCPINVAERRGE